LREEEQQKQLEQKEAAFLDLILRAYRAEKTGKLGCSAISVSLKPFSG